MPEYRTLILINLSLGFISLLIESEIFHCTIFLSQSRGRVICFSSLSSFLYISAGGVKRLHSAGINFLELSP
nr:MAG TPA: hypothetical protein [Bacteriophage sp.]